MEVSQATGDFFVVGVGPAEGGEGPQGGREPGVEDVVVLHQFNVVGQMVLGAHFGFVVANKDIAFGVVPGRNAMSPPQLAGDAPVLDVAHPAEVHVLVVFRDKLDVAVFDRFDGGFGQGFGIDVPLIGKHWLDDDATTVAVGDGEVVVFDGVEQAQCLEVGNNGLAGGKAFHATVFFRDAGVDVGIDRAIRIKRLGFVADVGVEGQDVDHRQAAAFANFAVIKIVSRGDFDATGALGHVGVFVTDDRDAAAN